MRSRTRIRKSSRFSLESLENRVLLSTYYVATTGSDSSAGSTSAPWNTLQKAADAAKAGDTVIVRAGTYAGMTLTGSAYPGGTSSAPITFIAGEGSGAGNWQTSGVTINDFSAKDNGGQYALINIEGNNGHYIIKGFNVSDNGSTQKAGIRVANSHKDQIINCQVSGAFTGIFASLADGIVIQGNRSHDNYGQHGIYVNGTSGYTILGNECYSNTWDGIHLNILDGGNTINTNGLIAGNSVHDNLLSGMDVTGASYCTFINNLAYGNGKHGVVLQNTNTNPTPACTNNVFINNTFDASNGMYGIEVTSGNGNYTTVFNNILLGSSSYGAIGCSTLPSSLKMSNNITSGSVSDLCVSAGLGNYHLKFGSAAIDAGTGNFNGYNAPSTDWDNAARPQGSKYDIGAFEYAPGNPLISAQGMGTISNGIVRALDSHIGTDNRNRLYRFTVGRSTRIAFKLFNMTDNADLMILNNSGQRIAYSKNNGASAESMTMTLAAGTYYIRVLFTRGAGSGTAYRLRAAGV